jgi:hypothetical protein
MANYTLKVCYGTETLEQFNKRSVEKLRSILSHPKYDRASETGPFGEPRKHPDTFEIFNVVMEKLHKGNIKETLFFIGTLK